MSDYLGAPRFRVTEIEGYGPGAMGHKYALATSFTIVDRAYCCREVWLDYSRPRMGLAPLWLRRVKANAKCDELNAKHAA